MQQQAPVYFTAKPDNISKAIPVIIGCTLIIPIVTLIRLAATKGMWEMYLIVAFLLLSLGIAYGYRPLAYEVSPGTLRIKRPFGWKTIPLEGLEVLKPLSRADLGPGIRTFGVGGFFGYYGYFYYRKLGKVILYATDSKKLILLQWAKRKIIVSPEETDRFLKEVSEAA